MKHQHPVPGLRSGGCSPPRRRQRGISLVFALITLVSLMLAALALVRKVDTGAMVLGNIAFQQDATVSADIAANAAVAWLTDATSDLTVSSSADPNSDQAQRTGFYAHLLSPLDVTGEQLTVASRHVVDWDLDGCKSAGGTTPQCSLIPHDVDMAAAGAPAGNTARYVIIRLCSADGAASADSCARSLTATAGGGIEDGACSEGDGCKPSQASGQYFRVIVRVKGARDTVSFTETIVQY